MEYSHISHNLYHLMHSRWTRGEITLKYKHI